MATRYRIGCTLGLMLGSLALQAAAEPPAATANNNGLMTFPNVRVENAPVDTSKQKPATGTAVTSGMRAYMNEEGQLTQATNADAAKLSNATPSAKLATAKSRTSSAATAADTGPQMTYAEDGSIEIMANEETMVFQTAHKDANGKVTQECVTGESNAKHALHSPARSKQESRNDR